MLNSKVRLFFHKPMHGQWECFINGQVSFSILGFPLLFCLIYFYQHFHFNILKVLRTPDPYCFNILSNRSTLFNSEYLFQVFPFASPLNSPTGVFSTDISCITFIVLN